MSDTVSVDYALVLVWLAICSLYTTLLTVTALSVVWILRKRRSSILKSQRPARTPFSELEFNVATPTDTAKSRRVSFSRRTGVAEFVTNEATTTWKNFYEEHNKSLESSSNDSEGNASRQPVGHLGKRIFDQQFEEVEAVDFMSGLTNGSLNNVNFSQQLASLECTVEGKLTAPHNKFELSAFTEQSKLFGNDFTAPSLGEHSGRIDVNFSAIQQVEKDDLDEIEKDLERGSNNMGCHGPFSDRQNMSEYIEVDLNMTHVAKNDEDMSITDTVHSPVQDVSKSVSINKKVVLNNDWVVDKENIAINPYAPPCETNFAVNEEPDQVLVFDGKRLTLQPDIPEKDKNYRQTLLPNSSAETPQRKTIVLNVNDDLPNFAEDMLNSKSEHSGFSGFQEIKTDEDEILDTLQMSRVHSKPKRLTTHDNTANISMTQVLPTNIICQAAVISQDSNPTMRRTIVFDKSCSDISVTEVVPAKVLSSTSSGTSSERRRTIVYEDDSDNVSMTQAVPSNILVNDHANTALKHNTVFDNEKDNKIVAQAPSSNILDEKPSKRKTIVFEDEACDVSITQAVPSNIMLADKRSQEKRRTIIYENDTGNVSVTQALPTNVILPNNNPNPERRRTIIYENDTGNVSVTQALPTNVILPNNNRNPERRRTIVYADDAANISVTQAIPSNIILEKLQLHENEENDVVENIPNTQSVTNDISTKDSETSRRKTIVYEDNTGNVSITQPIPAQLIPGYSEDKTTDVFNTSRKPKTRRRTTIVYDKDEGDISMTEAIPANIIEEVTNEGKAVVYDEYEANISTTLAISTNVFLLEKLDSTEDVKKAEEIEEVQAELKAEEIKPVMEKLTEYDVYEDNLNISADALQEEGKSNVYNPEYEDCDMSMTVPLPKGPSLREVEKGDMSMTKPIPAELITFGTELSDKLKDKLLDLTEPGQITNRQSDVIVLQNSRTNSKPMLQSSKSEQDDLKKIADNMFSNASDVSPTSPALVADDVRPTSPALVADDVSPSSPALVADDVRPTSPALVADDLPRSPVGGASLNTSLIHPRVEEKTNQLSLVTVDNVSVREEDAVMQTDPENTETSMSITTMDSGTEDKNIMARVDSSPSPTPSIKNTDGSSNESMFYITKDSEEEAQSDGEMDNKAKRADPKQISLKQLPMLQLEEDLVAVDELQKKLAELKTAVSQNESNRLFKNVSPDFKQVAEIDEDVEPEAQEHGRNKADDTQELLDMLSNLTDNRKSDEDIETVYIKVKEDDVTELKRLSFAPSRQSIVLSREDLLSNISMAQAALQKSRLALDDSDSIEDDTRDTSMKSDRANDVVKTLQFNDESISEESLNEYSPLKKTAFGETSYMHETKGKVIPTYLKDVSDGIKELMLDLVKPVNNEDLPYETGLVDKGVPTIASTQSTQVQANLYQSSQIDFEPDFGVNPSDPDLYSESESSNVYKSRSARSPVKFSGTLSELDDVESKEKFLNTHALEQAPAPSGVLIFDHLNPLNNVLIPPINLSEAHKYDPIPSKPDGTFDGFDALNKHSISARHNHSSREEMSRDFDVQTVCGVTTKKQRVPMMTRSSVTEEDEPVTNTQRRASPRTSPAQEKDIKIRSASIRRPSLEKSVDAVSRELRDYEVNTTITMKRNKELLETSSSLTLVDDGLECASLSFLPDNEFSKHKITFSHAAQKDSITNLSEDPVQDRFCSNLNASIAKGKKRIYSPSDKRKQQQSLVEVTPKPVTKMQKISSSPRVQIKLPGETSSTDESSHSMEPEKDENRSPDRDGHTSKSRDRKSPRSGKPGQTLTVRQLIADCISFESGFNHVQYIYPKSGNVTDVLRTEVSSSSGSVVNDVHNTSNMDCQPAQPTTKVLPSQADWAPKMCATGSSQHDSESGVNVVAKIDMLPFMGSHECEWEASSTTNISDTWSFRLLHGRLRLTARLAHRLDNAPRTRVRGDTPVLDIAVEAVHHDRKNPVAAMCVRFACETMCHIVKHTQRNICHASDIPTLLRRCAAVVRVALRWGRAMHDAKLHLSYKMDADGNLSLKVANIPLRSIWEVTMRVQLDAAAAVAWPRACDVRVLPVVSDVVVADDDVRRALAHVPKDWGHVPGTVWKLFTLLKHKKRDDGFLIT